MGSGYDKRGKNIILRIDDLSISNRLMYLKLSLSQLAAVIFVSVHAKRTVLLSTLLSQKPSLIAIGVSNLAHYTGKCLTLSL